MAAAAPPSATPPRDTQAQILDAAFRCFAQQGFAGTAMADIAAASGLSRTALYNHFADKEAVFRALSSRINDGVLAAVKAAAQAALQQQGSLEQRLAAVMEARVGWAFDLLHASAHGRELIDEKNRLCGAGSAEANARFLALLERIIRDGSGLAAAPAREAAGLLVDSVAGILAGESSEPRARRRLRRFIAIFAAGLDPGRARTKS